MCYICYFVIILSLLLGMSDYIALFAHLFPNPDAGLSYLCYSETWL